jgi:prepilin-type N-terminal cleavage/methylation domain-containing protein
VTSRRQAGFTLVELVVSLALLALAMAISAQLLQETQQMLVDAGLEALDPNAALVATRLRADILGASVAVAVQNRDDLSCAYLELLGDPPGPIFYQLRRGALFRRVFAADGTPLGASVLLRGATSFTCATVSSWGPTVVLVSYEYLRSRTRRSPLALPPALWRSRQETVRESLVLTPRGAGLGRAW